MLKKIGVYHLLPFIIACLFFFISYQLIISDLIDNNVDVKPLETKIISGAQTQLKDRYARLDNDNYELNYIASIKNKKQITLFGSSEFSESPYVTYNFLPSKKNAQILGVGHAHHQILSILIELLAAHPENKGSKVVFFLSPGWFGAQGTNSEAFVEFAKPNFLNRIVNDSSIQQKYKVHIGRFIDLKHSEFEGVSISMNYLRGVYLDSQLSQISNTQLEQFINKNFSGTKHKAIIPKVEYQLELTYLTPPPSIIINYDSIAHQLKNEFVANITSNNLYVNDDYYTKYLLKDDGTEREELITEIDISTNEEYQDFKRLVEYVKEREMEASFIIIPYNPYYFKNADIYLPLIDSLTSTLESNNLPYYNLYAGDTLSYDPGVLTDVMHFGDYGWMKVNKYIDSLYYGND